MATNTHETDLERWAAAAAWSRGAHLTPVEAVLWKAERHPAQSATSCLLIDLDSEPDWERFLAAIEWGTRLVRRLRQRILEPAVPTAPPAWVADEHFSLDYHVRRQVVGAGAERADLLRAAHDVAMRPFDRTRPLWEGVLFTGLEGGRSAFLLKIHHTLADGTGTVQLLSLLQSRTKKHTDDKPTAPTPAVSGATDPVALATDGLVREVAAAPGRAIAAARTGLLVALHPRAALSTSVQYAASLRRLVGTPRAPASPLLGARDGRTWQFLTLTCDLQDLRDAGAVVGSGLQDAFIAAVLGGMRRYHNHHDLALEDMTVRLRVSLDRADDPMSGNRFAGANISAPAGIIDAGDRIAAVRGEVLSLHTESALDAFSSLAPMIGLVPGEVLAAAMQRGPEADLQVNTIAGPTRTTYMAGAKVEGMYSFAPLPGVAVSATLVTFGQTACLGFNVDGAAVPDLDVLERALAEGIDEVVALGR